MRVASMGYGGMSQRLAIEMTRQYLAGELSVLLEHLQAVTFTEAAGRDAWSLRHAARRNRSRHWARLPCGRWHWQMACAGIR